MEITREIYWNVGHGLTTLGPMYLLGLVAFAVLVYGSLSRVRIYRQGKPAVRTDDPAARLSMMVKNMLLQSRVTRVAGPGLAHAVFFWGFLLLFIGTGLIVVQADFTDLLFDVVFLKGNVYKVFSIVLDLAGAAAVVMLFGFLVRRWLVKPAGLQSGFDDIVMHVLLFAILITGFLIEGARMAVTEVGTELAWWSPVGPGGWSRSGSLRFLRSINACGGSILFWPWCLSASFHLPSSDISSPPAPTIFLRIAAPSANWSPPIWKMRRLRISVYGR